MGSERFLIVCTGRDGSTLLSAILAESGADFNARMTREWNPRAGAYESWTVAKATAHYDQFIDLNAKSFLSPLIRFRRRIHRLWAKYLMRRHLGKGCFTKIGSAHRLSQLVRIVGYHPVIILLYRDYRAQFGSAFVRKPFTYSELADKYFNTLATGLLSLSIYGGCVISYEELVDPESTDWAKRLGTTCHIDPAVLLQSRSRLLKVEGGDGVGGYVMQDARLDALMEKLDLLRRMNHQPSRLGERS